MKVTTSSGRTYKVQFVHSSAPEHADRPATPGGLRQFVDNLAASLLRRVTFADISLVEPVPNEKEADSGPSFKYTSLGQGFAVCHHTDQFQKKTGRAYALDRALLNVRLDLCDSSDLSYLPLVEQDEIWEAVWNTDCPPSRPSEFGH
jgi:hypothetical protein